MAKSQHDTSRWRKLPVVCLKLLKCRGFPDESRDKRDDHGIRWCAVVHTFLYISFIFPRFRNSFSSDFFRKFFSGCMVRYLRTNVKLQLTMNKVDQSKRVDMKPETSAGSVLVLTKACPICIARKILMIFESTCCACTEITQTIFVATPVAVSLSH